MTSALLPIPPELVGRLNGIPLIVMLDVDGTLAPITPRPQDVSVPLETRRTIASLAATAGVSVALVSGRAAADARRIVGVANVWVIGNHGFEIIGPDGEEIADGSIAGHRRVVSQASHQLGPRVAAVPGVVFEDKGLTLSIHYRLAHDAVIPRLRATIEETVAALGLRLTSGKRLFEIRPPGRVDKGTAVVMLALRLRGLADGASLILAGDDETDEDAFRALRARKPAAVTVQVTHGEQRPTSAEFTLRDTGDMGKFLEWLLASRR